MAGSPVTSWKAMPRWLLAITGVAVIAGLYARFKGLGASPYSVDEYYLARSIEDVLRTGLPVFDCGGYYMRGLLLQYTAAGLQMTGLGPELTPRLVGALCSVLSLPAAYLLGRRLHSPAVGLLLVVLLALSVWEVEMSRFGRMYAPFQALFLWYSLYFVRFTVDRETRALWMMIGLSIAAPLVWEGGALLALANLLALFLLRPAARLAWRDVWPLCAGVVLLIASFLLVLVDFRLINGDEFPVGFDHSPFSVPQDPLTTLGTPLAALRAHPLWLLWMALPLALAAWSLHWISSFRARPLLALGLLLILAAAMAHQFLLVAVVGVLLLLLRYLHWNELFSRAALPFYLALATTLLFWLVFSVLVLNWRGAGEGSTARGLAMAIYPLTANPDFINVVVRPLGRALPLMGGGLLLLVAVAVWRNMRHTALTAERALLILLVALVMAACFASPARMETRYIYFAYPLTLLIALATLAALIERFVKHEAAATLAFSGLALGGFAMTEDFQPAHLRHVDSPAILYRTNLSDATQGHYESREDLRTMAQWLQQNAPTGTVLINSVHGLDTYFPAFSHFYADERSSEIGEWTCRRGSVERWGNYPLLYTTAALAEVARHAPKTLLVTFNYDEQALLQAFAAANPRIVRRQGHLVVLELRG